MPIISFPGATTPGQSISASGPYTEIAETGIGQAEAFKSTADGQYQALKTAADSAKATAATEIGAAMGFSPGVVPAVDYVIPAPSSEGNDSIASSLTTAAPTFTPTAMVDFSASFSAGTAPDASTATAPTIPTVTLTPVTVDAAPDALTAPATPTLSVSPPTYTPPALSNVALPTPPSAVNVAIAATVFGSAPEPLTIAPIGTDALLEAKATFEALLALEVPVVGPPNKPASYIDTTELDFLITNTFSKWSSGGTFVKAFNAELGALSEKFEEKRVDIAGHSLFPLLWQGRAAVVSPAEFTVSSSYSSTIEQRELEATSRQNAARNYRWTYEEASQKRAAYLSLYSMVNELDLKRYQVEVDLLAYSATVELEKVKVAISDYNGAVAVLAAQAETYAAQLQTYDANVRRFKAQIQAEEVKADLNEGRSRTFGIEAQAESSKRQTYEAALSVEKQKIDALATRIAARGLELSKAQFALEKYKADALTHSNNLLQTRKEFSAYSVRASAAASANRAEATKARVEAAKLQLSSQQARREVAKVEAKNAELRAQIVARTANLQATIAKNSAAAVQAGAEGAIFESTQLTTVASAIKARASASISVDKAQAASRFAVSATQAASQATQLAQSVNTTLANAYAALYEAAGRASAAVAAGEFSGFRAAKSVSASYNVSGSREYSNSETQVRQKSVSQEDQYDAEGAAF